MKKKILVATAVSALTVSLFSGSVFAAEAPKAEAAKVVSNDKNAGIKETPTTREAYLLTLAKERGLSMWGAEQYDRQQSEKAQAQMIAAHPEVAQTQGLSVVAPEDSYMTIENTQKYSQNTNFSAKVMATLKIYSYGSFRQINDVTGVGSARVSGMYNYTWNQNYAWTSPTSSQLQASPATAIDIGATGYFSIVTSVGVSVGGFGVSGSTGTDVTQTSDTMNLTYHYSLY